MTKAVYFIPLLCLFGLSYSMNIWSSKNSESHTHFSTLNPEDPSDYGVDTTSPVHHGIDKYTHWGKRYYDLMDGCYKWASKPACDATESARLEMNRDQPSHQINYTAIGFKKIRAPKNLWDPLIAFYERNKNQEHNEDWPKGNTYVNNWELPTTMISFEDKNLREGWTVKKMIWDAAKPVLEEWTGKKLVETSLYGIRVYKNGAILATHVDRLPLVSSAIVQVAQDIDEPWPIEVFSHDGKAYNVTMQPGDMVMYESHTVLHGRPFPMKGRFYANVFVHFAPIDHDEENERFFAAKQEPLPPKVANSMETVKKTLASVRQKIGGHEQSNHDEDTLKRHEEAVIAKTQSRVPDAVLSEGSIPQVLDNFELTRGSNHSQDVPLVQSNAKEPKLHPPPEYIAKHEHDHEHDHGAEAAESREEEGAVVADKRAEIDGRTALHVAAATGDMKEIIRLLRRQETDILHSRDENGWQAIHEAARGGFVEILKYLIELGADIGAETDSGGTPLWWARRFLEENHPVIRYLVELGAPEGSGDEGEVAAEQENERGDFEEERQGEFDGEEERDQEGFDNEAEFREEDGEELEGEEAE